MAKILIPGEKEITVTGIVFDLSGTLLKDGDAIYDRAIISVLGRYGVTPSTKSVSADYYRFLEGKETSGDELLYPYVVDTYLNGKITPDRFGDEFSQEIRSALRNDAVYQPYAADFLCRCREAGLPIALVTSMLDEQLQQLCANENLNKAFPLQNFTHIFTNDKGIGYVNALKVLDPLRQHNIMVFEDNPKGVKAVRTACARSNYGKLSICGVNAAAEDMQQVRELADFIVDTHKDIIINK